jgi:hypothetical protein
VSFTIDEIQLSDLDSLSGFDGRKIITSTSIERDLSVSGKLPVSLSWRVAVLFTTDAKSTMICTADVRGPDWTVVTTGALTFDVEIGSTRGEISLSQFVATATGTYTVRVRANGVVIWVKSVNIAAVNRC